MLIRLVLLFTLVPVIELAVLIQIGRRIGVLETIALVLAAGVAGAYLARRAGVRAVAQVQADLAAGRLPADSLLDGLIVLAAGVMLITPGVVTDLLGLLLLLPPVRAVLRTRLKSRWRGRMVVFRGGSAGPAGEWVDVEPRSAHDVETRRGQLPEAS